MKCRSIRSLLWNEFLRFEAEEFWRVQESQVEKARQIGLFVSDRHLVHCITLSDGVDDILSFDDFTEYGVSVVEVGCGEMGDEEFVLERYLLGHRAVDLLETDILLVGLNL